MMGQHWLLPPCTWRVMIWGERWGGWGSKGTRCWWQRNDRRGRGDSGCCERGHLPFLLGAAIDCLGVPRKGARRPRSLWKPELTTICLTSDRVSRRAWPGEQDSITTVVSHRRKGPSPGRLLWPAQAPAVPQTVPGMKMLSGRRLTPNPTDETEQCSRPHPGPASGTIEAKTRNTGTAIQGFWISKCLANISGT